MALVTIGTTRCLLCGQTINDLGTCIGFPHFIEDEEDPLSIYSDACFHKLCFDNWLKKEEFLEKLNAFEKVKLDRSVKSK